VAELNYKYNYIDFRLIFKSDMIILKITRKYYIYIFK